MMIVIKHACDMKYKGITDNSKYYILRTLHVISFAYLNWLHNCADIS